MGGAAVGSRVAKGPSFKLLGQGVRRLDHKKFAIHNLSSVPNCLPASPCGLTFEC
jgi:hypothetical protein